MRYFLLLISTCVVLTGCRPYSAPFGFAADEVDSIYIKEAGTLVGQDHEWRLNESQKRILVGRILTAAPDAWLLVVKHSYEIRLILKSGRDVSFNSNGNAIALSTSTVYYRFKEDFDLKDLHP